MSNIGRDPKKDERSGAQRGFPPARNAANRNAARSRDELSQHPGFQPHGYDGREEGINQYGPSYDADYEPSAGSIEQPPVQYDRPPSAPGTGYIPPQGQTFPSPQGAAQPGYGPGQPMPRQGQPSRPPLQPRPAYYPPGSNLGEPLKQDRGSIGKGILKFLGWTLLIGLLMLGIFVGAGWWTLRSTTDAIFNTDTKTTIVTKAPVVNSLKQVNKQIFIEHNNMVDVDYSEAPEGWLSYLPIEQSFVVLLRGTVPAGFDLSDLSEDDVWISDDGKKIQLVLPPPVIFDDNVSVNFEESRILVEGDTCPNFLCSENLEAIQSEIIPQGRALLVETSMKSGIMEQAAEMGIHYYESLLRSLGFEEIQVLIRADLDIKPDLEQSASD